MYGGEGSNRTKDRIILESILVTIYRESHSNLERNFALAGLSHMHAEKDMTETFKVILEHIATCFPNEYKAGRTATYIIPNVLADGAATIEEEAVVGRTLESESQDAGLGDGAEGAVEEEELFEVELTAEDLSIDGLL